MTNTWFLGRGDRKIRVSDWASLGIVVSSDTEWTIKNAWSVDEATLVPEQITWLHQQPQFMTGQTGPRNIVPPKTVTENIGSAYAYYLAAKALIENFDPGNIPTKLADLDTTVTGAQLDSDHSKLSGVANNATANDTDANLKNRSNHTGRQPASSISDFIAKGDLIVGTGATTATRVPVASNGLSVVSDSAQSAGLRWGTAGLSPLPGAPTLGEFMKPTIVGPAVQGLTSYSITTSSPSYSGMQYISYPGFANRFRFGGVFSSVAGLQSGTYWNAGINGSSTAGFNITSSEIECDVYGTDITFHLYSYGKHDLRAIVDGVAVKPDWEHCPSGNNQLFMKFQFDASGRAVHRIRLLLGQIGFIQALIPSTGKIIASPPRFRALFTGDSFGHGGNAIVGPIDCGTLCGEIALQTGWEVWNAHQGGTGPINDPASEPTVDTSPYGSTSRKTAISTLVPAVDLIGIVGSANDASYDPAASAAAVIALAQYFKSVRPNTPIIWFGVESGVYDSISGTLNTLNNAYKVAAANNPNLITCYIDSRTSPWVTGTGNESAWANDGTNADLAVASDTVHRTHYGWGEIDAKRTIEALKPVRIPAAA